MLHLIRNNNPLTALILAIYALAINWQVLFDPQMPVVPEGDFLFYIITGFFGVVLFKSAFGFTLLSVIMIVLEGLLLNAVVNRHKLFAKPTFATAFVYISLASIYHKFGYFSQPILVNWVLILLIDMILQLAHANKPAKLIYNAGFAVGIAALILFPASLLIIVLLMAIFMLRNFKLTEWVIALMGIATPIYFAAGLLFLFDVSGWLPQWVNVGFNLPRKIESPANVIGMLAGGITLLVLGAYSLQKNMGRSSLFVRRGWTTVTVCLVVSILVALFTVFEVRSAWLVTIPALSMIVANAFNNEKNKAFSNFTFYFILLLVVFCNMTSS